MNKVSILLLVGIFFVACTKKSTQIDETKQELKSEQEVQVKSGESSLDSRINTLLKKEIETLSFRPGEAANFDVVYNKTADIVSIENIQIKELGFFPISGNPSDYVISANGTYTVDCDLGDNSWSKTCDGKWSCGSLIYDCLNAKGCAEICNASVVFIPPNYNEFIRRKK